MKTKYRVKQIGDKFYPQYKKFLFWRNITFPDAILNNYDLEPVRNCLYFYTGMWHIKDNVRYTSSLSDAERLIDKFIECKDFKYCYKGHKIIKIYNHSTQLLYIDKSIVTRDKFNDSVFPIFSGDLTTIKCEIDEAERKLKTSKIRNIYDYR